MSRNLTWGSVPVPYSASWTGEEGQFLGRCPHARVPALMQRSAMGEGKPIFGTPHSCRQRETIIKGLCDLCGKSLATSTKVSLSHQQRVPHGAHGWAILQTEPLLHRRCALTSVQHCPSLLRDIRAGTLNIRQVQRYRVQIAQLRPEYVEEQTGEHVIAAGHAKVELLQWQDRDLEWLERAA